MGFEESPAPESLLLDIGGLAELFDGEASLAHQLSRYLAEAGYSSRLAIADTAGAAWAMAHRQSSRAAAERVVIVPPGDERRALAPLPLAALRLSAEVIEMLTELGIRSIGALAGLPRDALHGRFGPEPLRQLDRAWDARADVVTAEKPWEPLEVEWPFEFPTDRRATIEAAVERLLARLTDSLAAQSKGILPHSAPLGPLGGVAARV